MYFWGMLKELIVFCCKVLLQNLSVEMMWPTQTLLMIVSVYWNSNSDQITHILHCFCIVIISFKVASQTTFYSLSWNYKPVISCTAIFSFPFVYFIPPDWNWSSRRPVIFHVLNMLSLPSIVFDTSFRQELPSNTLPQSHSHHVPSTM